MGTKIPAITEEILLTEEIPNRTLLFPGCSVELTLGGTLGHPKDQGGQAQFEAAVLCRVTAAAEPPAASVNASKAIVVYDHRSPMERFYERSAN